MKALLKRKFLPVFTTTFLAYKQCLAHIEFSIIVNFLNKRMKKGRRKERNKESIEIAVLELEWISHQIFMP